MEGKIDPFKIEEHFDPSQIPDSQMQQLKAGKFIITELTSAGGYGLMSGVNEANNEQKTNPFIRYLYYAIPASVLVLGCGIGIGSVLRNRKDTMRVSDSENSGWETRRPLKDKE